jgi:hypothetical protein
VTRWTIQGAPSTCDVPRELEMKELKSMTGAYLLYCSSNSATQKHFLPRRVCKFCVWHHILWSGIQFVPTLTHLPNSNKSTGWYRIYFQEAPTSMRLQYGHFFSQTRKTKNCISLICLLCCLLFEYLQNTLKIIFSLTFNFLVSDTLGYLFFIVLKSTNKIAQNSSMMCKSPTKTGVLVILYFGLNCIQF